jgi:hypothetical protein
MLLTFRCVMAEGLLQSVAATVCNSLSHPSPTKVGGVLFHSVAESAPIVPLTWCSTV